MSTFLELGQGVAREAGAVADALPTSMVGQTGRPLSIVECTKGAWLRVQNLHASWRWMRTEFPSTAVTTSGSARYTAASWNITDHAEWLAEQHLVTIYNSATGVSDEGEIAYVPWERFRPVYLRGTQTNNRPGHWSISPANEFVFGPAPDDTYRVNGEYRKTAQILSANLDEPECPARFHDVIKWLAVVMYSEFDEVDPLFLQRAQLKYSEFLGNLERDQLPQITIGSRPIA